MFPELLINVLNQVDAAVANRFNHFLILGYFVMWLVAMVYLFTLANRQHNAEKDIELMKKLLAEDEEFKSQ